MNVYIIIFTFNISFDHFEPFQALDPKDAPADGADPPKKTRGSPGLFEHETAVP